MANYWNALFYRNADYDGFSIPRSEGGKGPEDAREVMGLEFDHHAGMQTRTLLDGETAAQAAYRYVRETHHFLTDDNHTWELVPAAGPDHWMSSVRVIKNEKSSLFALKPWWMEDGPGVTWFEQRFRVATVGMIAAEVDADLRTAHEYRYEAEAQRDTIRGRKRASQLRSFAHSAQWRGAVAPTRRWPIYFPPEKIAA